MRQNYNIFSAFPNAEMLKFHPDAIIFLKSIVASSKSDQSDKSDRSDQSDRFDQPTRSDQSRQRKYDDSIRGLRFYL